MGGQKAVKMHNVICERPLIPLLWQNFSTHQIHLKYTPFTSYRAVYFAPSKEPENLMKRFVFMFTEIQCMIKSTEPRY